jgi:hypothetical protein
MVPEVGVEPTQPFGSRILGQNRKGGGSTFY